MTIREALDQRIRFVRLPHWAPRAHIELPLMPDGLHFGPWAIVRDVSGEESIFIGLLLKDPEDRYEALP